MRSDYFNLASGVKDAAGRPALFERLTADNNDAVLRLKAMSPAGLREAVLEPLKLAGETNETALADAVQTDISHQASDLPLLQVALRAAWQRHHPNGPPMLECYQSVGRVSGALANEADMVAPAPASGRSGPARIDLRPPRAARRHRRRDAARRLARRFRPAAARAAAETWRGRIWAARLGRRDPCGTRPRGAHHPMAVASGHAEDQRRRRAPAGAIDGAGEGVERGAG